MHGVSWYRAINHCAVRYREFIDSINSFVEMPPEETLALFKKILSYNVHGYNYGGYNEALVPVGYGSVLCLIGVILWVDTARKKKGKNQGKD